ncbi:hypothetical protein Bpfe_001554, partial [Biomphalaria pfeifferi]
ESVGAPPLVESVCAPHLVESVGAPPLVERVGAPPLVERVAQLSVYVDRCFPWSDADYADGQCLKMFNLTTNWTSAQLRTMFGTSD